MVSTNEKRTGLTSGKASPDGVAKWWLDFRQNGNQEARNRLLENYLPVVKYTAERLKRRLPDEIDVNDLISAGIFGLFDALKAYDLTRGVKFETYCAPRIRGAMLDELRAMDWVPRLVRNRAHRLKEAIQILRSQLGREPTQREFAKHLKMSLKDFRKFWRDAKAVGVVSLNRKWFETDSGKDLREIDILPDVDSNDPSFAAQRRELKELVIQSLSRAERLIIILYYFEEMTMKEIGETLDLSESRVSQMHSAILVRLRESLRTKQDEFNRVA